MAEFAEEFGGAGFFPEFAAERVRISAGLAGGEGRDGVWMKRLRLEGRGGGRTVHRRRRRAWEFRRRRWRAWGHET